MDTNTLPSPSSPSSLAVVPFAESAYAKMKKMISSPRGKRRASAVPSPKTFGVSLEEVLSRDTAENGVPFIVHRICNYIIKNGLQVEGIFRVNANMKTVEKLKTSIEKTGDADFEDTGDVMAAASLLKMFLRELPDSVIPDDMQPGFIKAQSLREDKEQHLLILRYLIQKMPDANYYLLKYLIDFLNKVADNADSNKMTGVALAVVFGPNIFRCSDSLQGLQEQACVNAITCKLIEKYEYLFSIDSKDTEDSQKDKVDGSSTPDKSPRSKPARPPPPKFSQAMQSPRKMHPDENSNMVEDSGMKILSRSISESHADVQTKVPRIETNGNLKEPQGRKKYNRSVTINSSEPSRSLSPQKTQRSLPSQSMPSPSSKQIVDTTIRDAVKEHLFGMGMVTSSSESDTQVMEPAYSPEQSPVAEEIQQPIRDVLKRFTAEKLSESMNISNDVNSTKKQGPKTMKKPNQSEVGKTIRNAGRPMSFPSNESSTTIDADSLEMMKEQWTGTLTSLTLHRAPPPKTRRQRRAGKSRSENIDELFRNSENETTGSNDVIKTSKEQDITTEANESVNRTSQKQTENPLLIKIKNEKYSKSKALVNESGGTRTSAQQSPRHHQSSEPASPRKTELRSSTEESKTNKGYPIENETKEKPVIPPLDLFRIQQDDSEETETRFSPKERFSHVLVDSPIRSPRYLSSEGGPEDTHHVHREQIFMEKRQDTVPILDMSAKDLKKRIESLRKIITNFENSFEAEHHRAPKASEKGQVQKYIAELGRAKKQLRELLNTIKENPDRAEASQTGPEIGFAPNMRDISSRDTKPSKEDTLHLLLRKLQEKRGSAGRPEEIEVMSSDQLKDEKLAVQKALLQFENLHGRPTSKEDKTLMRPIYERYRRIKRMIATGKDISTSKVSEISSDTVRSQESAEKSPKDLQPIIEGIPLPEPGKDENEKGEDTNDTTKDDDLNDTFNITRKPQDFSKISRDTFASSISQVNSATMSEAVLHDATLEELLQQQKLAKKSKKTLGKTLKEYEDDFLAENGRKVQKEDRGPYEAEYSEYKLIKARLRLLEALITKKRVNQTV